VKVFELSGAAEAVVAKRPRPAAAKAPMMKDRIHNLLCFFSGGQFMRSNDVPYG
jgi:hypothetical protein